MLPFLSKFKKELAKLANVTTDFRPPSHWYTTGNYAVNKILSGDFHRGIPQGRVTIFAGPSDSGKSFLLSNVMAAAQRDGAFIFAIDSENALDHEYLGRLGVNSHDESKFMGVSVVTISDVVSVISDFVKMYEKEYGKYNKDAPRVLIALDSLDMLLTDSENAHFDDGVQKGDQGQRAKQMKGFLRTMVSRIKALNISFIGTHQVYPADVLQGEGKWAINNAIRYSASQIVLITKLKLKTDGEVSGIRMYVETFKSRFAKLGSKVEVMVPYDKGMNPNSGLLELLENQGIVNRSGAWWQCQFPGEDRVFSFQSTKVDDALVQKLLSHPKLQEEAKLFEETLMTPEVGVDVEETTTTEETI
jgi:recombination protein RecA